MRLLIGLDGSDLALDAARASLAVLRQDATVTLVRVVRRPVPATVITGIAPAEALVMADAGPDDEAAARLKTEAAEDLAASASALGVSADRRVLVGDPGPEMCALAASEEFDLVVVGSHGSGFLKRVLLGSVSHHVLHHAPCPVLVVRGGER